MRIHTGIFIIIGSAILLSLSFMAISQMKSDSPSKKAQTVDNPPKGLSGSDYPTVTMPTDEPMPSLSSNNDVNLNAAAGGNAGNIQQGNNSIIQIQQQIQSEMASCVQKKQQLYNQLVTQKKQLAQLQAKYDALGKAIGNAKTDQQTTVLQNQQNQVQDAMDQLDNTSSGTQTALDQLISDCQDRVSNLQARQDDLQTQLSDIFDKLLEYQTPD